MASDALFTMDGDTTACEVNLGDLVPGVVVAAIGWERGAAVGQRAEERELAFVEVLSGEPVFLAKIVVNFDLVVPLRQNGWGLINIVQEPVGGVVRERVNRIKELRASWG